jgi:hypothetical protein
MIYRVNTLKKVGVCGAFAMLGMCGAQASEFNFTYSDTQNPDAGHGSLYAIENGNTGTYTAISGDLIVTAGADSPGTYSLLGDPSAPSEILSPSGFFFYDDQLYPGTDPGLSNGGLLFVGVSPNGATEINIFSSGPGATFQFYDNTGYHNDPNGTFTLTTAPGPAAAVPLALGFLANVRKRRRSKQS